MSESATWKRVQAALRGRLHMVRVTERLNGGVPDVAYVGGWLELKHAARHCVRIPDLRADQSLWLWNWARGGGRAGVLLHVDDGDWWYYWRANAHRRDWPVWVRSPEAMDGADWMCRGGLDWKALLQWMVDG